MYVNLIAANFVFFWSIFSYISIMLRSYSNGSFRASVVISITGERH